MPNNTSHRGESNDDARAAMSRPPGGFLRWGMWLIAAFAALLLTLAALIRYPVVVAAEVEIVQGMPPVRIIAKSSGVIDRLLVKDSALVKAGQMLAVTRQSTDFEEVQLLEVWLQSVADNHTQEIPAPPVLLSLGSLQSIYSETVYQLERWQRLQRLDDTALRLQSLRRQLQSAEELDAVTSRQMALLDTTIALADRNFREYSALAQSGAASKLEAEQALFILLQHKKEREQQRALSLNYRQEKEKLQLAMAGAQRDFELRFADDYAAWQAAMGQLRGAVATWKDTWCYVAPAGGRIIYAGVRHDGQAIEQGQELFAIIPSSTGRGYALTAHGWLPATGSGALKPGAAAKIRLFDYPYGAYGEITARLHSISPVSSEDGRYYFTLDLQEGLTASTNFHAPFKYGMRGSARLIGERRSLINRLDRFNRSDRFQR